MFCNGAWQGRSAEQAAQAPQAEPVGTLHTLCKVVLAGKNRPTRLRCATDWQSAPGLNRGALCVVFLLSSVRATGAWQSEHGILGAELRWSRATLSICILNVWALSLRRLPARAACACTVAAGDCSRSHQSTRHSLPDLPARQPRRCGSRFAGSLSRHWLP